MRARATEPTLPRLPGDGVPARRVADPTEQLRAATSARSTTDEVVTLLVTAAAEHDSAGRRALAASLRQHACELLHPGDDRDAHLVLIDELLG